MGVAHALFYNIIILCFGTRRLERDVCGHYITSDGQQFVLATRAVASSSHRCRRSVYLLR